MGRPPVASEIFCEIAFFACAMPWLTASAVACGFGLVVVLTMEMPDPTGYGRIIREADGSVARIVEQKDASPEEAAVTECNSGFYCFDAKALFEALGQVGSDNAQGEFYLTDVLEISRNAGRAVLALPAKDPNECLGINTREQLAAVEEIARAR